MKNNNLPNWDLSSIYPSTESEEYKSDMKKVYSLSSKLKKKCKDKSVSILSILNIYDEMMATAVNLGAYTNAAFTVNTTSSTLMLAISEIDKMESELTSAVSEMTYSLAEREDEFSLPELESHKLFLEELKTERKHMMSLPEESLASEMLSVSAKSWSRLQENVTSLQTEGGKTLTELRGKASDPDRKVRQNAFEKEIKLLERNSGALAFALNGVKGTTLLLEKRRGWKDPLDRSLNTARISKKTLNALISALEESLPIFREYYGIKAKLLGLEKLDWCDIIAPVGSADMSYTFEEAKELVISCYTGFSKEVGEFIKNAFDKNWIDVPSHQGKVGGAYDTAFPLKKESRVMINWDGTYESVSTLSHELGHAYHDSVMKDLPYSEAEYPMTLAETASIFGETIVFNEVMKTATKEQQLSLIEQMVQSSAQVCVDILSRFYFEKSAFEERKKGDVSASRYSELMLDAEERTYGDAIGVKHPYMWGVKSHYYSEGFSFYNYPYAFGQLFALGLYSSKDSIPNFPEHYKHILSMTGRFSAEDCAKEAGIDITKKSFWLKGIEYIHTYIEKLKEWL